MSKKRRTKDVDTTVKSYQNVGDYSRENASFSKLDDATLSYYKEIRSHIDGLTDEEQRSMLAANALEETRGKEAEVGGDKVCSRVLEVLLAVAPPEAVEQFAAGALAPDTFIALASSPNGSHVAERLCEALMSSGTERSHQILLAASKVVGDKLYEFATDRFGSHVARRLVGLAGGIDGQGLPGATPANEGRGTAQRPNTGLAAKVGLQNREVDGSGSVGHEQLLEPISAALLGEGCAQILAEELPYHQYGGAFLQTVLLANRGNEVFLGEVIPKIFGAPPGAEAGNPFAAVSSEDFHAMLQERTSSHLMEVVASVAPEQMREQMYERFYKNHLAFLAMHPVANFVVQAVLATINKSPQMKAVIKELRGSHPTLLRSRRGGVIAAALAAGGRTGAGQVDLGKAVAAALRELPGNQQGLAAALLTLDLGARLEGLDARKRLSTLGCTMLISLFGYIKEASTEYLDSLLDLPPKELARVAADPGGSRVMDALIQGPCTAKFKKKLLKKLQGYYAATAATPGGNFLIEKCYTYAGLKEKEVIAEELAKAASQLATTPRGMKLLLRVAEFKKSSAKWRNQVQAADALKQEFADIFTDAPAHAGKEEAAEVKTPPKKRRRKEKDHDVAPGAEHDAAAVEIDDAHAPDGQSPGNAAVLEAAEQPGKRKKKRKSVDMTADPLAAEVSKLLGEEAKESTHEPAKKKRKKKAKEVAASEEAPNSANGDNKISTKEEDGVKRAKKNKKAKKAKKSGAAKDQAGHQTAEEDHTSGPSIIELKPPILGAAADQPADSMPNTAVEVAAKSSRKKKQKGGGAAKTPDGGGVQRSHGAVGASGAGEGGANGVGEGTIMESLTVDGVLTKLEVFEDKAAVPSALVKGPGQGEKKPKKKKGAHREIPSGRREKSNTAGRGKARHTAEAGKPPKSKKRQSK